MGNAGNGFSAYLALKYLAVYFDSKVIAGTYLYISTKLPLCHCSSSWRFIVFLHVFVYTTGSESKHNNPKLSSHHSSSSPITFCFPLFHIAHSGEDIKAGQHKPLLLSLARVRIWSNKEAQYGRYAQILSFQRIHSHSLKIKWRCIMRFLDENLFINSDASLSSWVMPLADQPPRTLNKTHLIHDIWRAVIYQRG